MTSANLSLLRTILKFFSHSKKLGPIIILASIIDYEFTFVDMV